MKLTDAQLGWFYGFINRLLERKMVLQLMSDADNRESLDLKDNTVEQLKDSESMTDEELELDFSAFDDGDVVDLTGENGRFGYISGNELVFLSEGSTIPVPWSSTFQIKNGLIANYTKNEEETTSVGRLLLNYAVLAEPFGDVFEYVNDIWKPGKIEDMIADALRNDDVTVEQTKKAINQAYYIGSLSHLCVVTATEKSFKTDDRVEQRKRELLEEHKGELDDPIVAKKIEDELIELDKEYIQDDNSERYYNAMGEKSFSNHRKKMHVTEGSMPKFEEGTSNYEFVENSLKEGWDPEDFPTIVNELRKGSFNRGFQTALGGAMAKNLLRLFQNVEMTENDCQTDRTVQVTLPADEIENYKGRTVIVNGEKVVITKDNLDQYADKKVNLRTPAYCRTQNGLCYTCAGQIFREMSQKSMNMMIVEVANTFMDNAMQAMHDTTVQTVTIEDLSEYFSPFAR